MGCTFDSLREIPCCKPNLLPSVGHTFFAVPGFFKATPLVDDRDIGPRGDFYFCFPTSIGHLLSSERFFIHPKLKGKVSEI